MSNSTISSPPSIGSLIIGGTPNRVLYINSAGKLAVHSTLTFDGLTFAAPQTTITDISSASTALTVTGYDDGGYGTYGIIKGVNAATGNRAFIFGGGASGDYATFYLVGRANGYGGFGDRIFEFIGMDDRIGGDKRIGGFIMERSTTKGAALFEYVGSQYMSHQEGGWYYGGYNQTPWALMHLNGSVDKSSSGTQESTPGVWSATAFENTSIISTYNAWDEIEYNAYSFKIAGDSTVFYDVAPASCNAMVTGSYGVTVTANLNSDDCDGVRYIRSVNGGGFNEYKDVTYIYTDSGAYTVLEDDNSGWTSGSTVTPSSPYTWGVVVDSPTTFRTEQGDVKFFSYGETTTPRFMFNAFADTSMGDAVFTLKHDAASLDLFLLNLENTGADGNVWCHLKTVSSDAFFGLRDHQPAFQHEPGYPFRIEEWGAGLGEMQLSNLLAEFATIQAPSANAYGQKTKVTFTEEGISLYNASDELLMWLIDDGTGDSYFKLIKPSTGQSFVMQGTGFQDGGTNNDLLTYASTTVVINEGSNDIDFRVEGNTEDKLLYVDAGGDYITAGDYDTNYTKWDNTGHQTMYGNARPWRDELSDALSIKSLGTGVSANSTENTMDFIHTAQLADYLYCNVQLNHDKDLTASIYPHIHFFQAENAAPNFMLQYRWQVNGGTKTTSWTNYKCNTLAHSYSSGTIHQIAYGAAISVPGGSTISDIVQFRIIRDHDNASTLFSGNDPYTATVGVLAFDVHFMINSLGSTDEYTK